MAVNGGHDGTKKGPNWGHVTFYRFWPDLKNNYKTIEKRRTNGSTITRPHPLPQAKLWTLGPQSKEFGGRHTQKTFSALIN